MFLNNCPECGAEVNEEKNECEKCGFDLEMYKHAYNKIYAEKVKKLNELEHIQEHPKIIYRESVEKNEGVHKPRCPYCNSEDLTRITAVDKAVNIALFGILGNKRKYQWHCNHCKTNW